MSTTLEQLNILNKKEFVETLGWVYEHSPWVAARTWCCKPFNSLAHLHLTMSTVVQQATTSEQLQLIKAHPDLAARIDMADASVKEQSSAGLDSLSQKEYTYFLKLNQDYKDKFGFPFIIAVRGLNKFLIQEAMQKRMDSNMEEEKKEAIRQINNIAQLRLLDLIEN
jgi:2-oxo-4-hydroxy-4-carboxy-5-ureidoimidazoline decarboxylase